MPIPKKQLQDLLLSGIARGLSERRELHELAESVAATESQFRSALDGLVANRKVQRGKRPSHVPNRPFAYTYHLPAPLEQLSEAQLLQRAEAKMAELLQSKAGAQ